MIPPLSKTLLFRSPHLVPNVPHRTVSPTWNGTGIIVHTASMILVANAQLVWHVSIMQSLSCESWTFGRRLIEVVVTLPGIPDSKAARCFIRAICCCLLAKKIKLTPFKKSSSSKRGLLLGTSWNWHICPLHAWKQLSWCQYGQPCKKLEKVWRKHFVWCAFFLQCSEIDSDCFEIF